MVILLSRPRDVLPFLDSVIKHADLEKDALGFFPEAVYRQFAAQGKLLVAVEGNKYAGHLLFGAVAPHARVLQTHVRRQCRGRGIGRKLIEELVGNAEQWNYLSLTARVASDLEANNFYRSVGFKTVRTTPGGATRKRLINIMVRELDTTTLFKSSRSTATDLGLVQHLPTRTPQYVLDLNVIFDLIRNRTNAESAGQVMKAAFNNLIRLAVTGEFIEELRRNSQGPDPLLAFALKLPVLAQPLEADVSPMLNTLQQRIFPSRAADGRLPTEDRSDLIHVTTGIVHTAAGFVTGEKAILEAREFLKEQYGLDIVATGELAALFEESVGGTFPQKAVTLQDIELTSRSPDYQDQLKLIDLFSRAGVSGQSMNELSTGLASHKDEQRVVFAGSEPIAFAIYITGHRSSVDAFVCADEDSPAVETALDHLFDHICRISSQNSPALVRLRLVHGHSKTMSVALSHGFRTSPDEAGNDQTLYKVCVGKCVTISNWSSIRSGLQNICGLMLPETPPTWANSKDVVEIITPAGNSIAVGLDDLETFLSPVLLLLPGRPSSIVPIRARFVADLFGNPSQPNLLHSAEATFLRERVYFSDPKTSPLLQKGRAIFFYESGKDKGRSSVVAAARVVRTDLLVKEGVISELLRRGVLTEQKIKRMGRSRFSAATIFDNIFHFRTPVTRKRLGELGFKDPANLITTKSFSDKFFEALIQEGSPGV
jgi:GNAT superfamily N-acetyltransferase